MTKLSLNDYTSIHESALRKGKNQRKFADFLREHNFDFFHTYTLEELGVKLNLLPEHQNLQIAILREGEQINPFLFYVFHLMGKRTSSIYVYINNQYFDVVHIPLAHDNHNFRKPIAGFKFPNYMTYDERKDWRYQHLKIVANKMEPTSFYLEHKPHVKILK